MDWKVKFLELTIRLISWPMKREVTGTENVPRDRGFIAVSNHNSFTDGLFLPQVLVTAIGKPSHFISYAELFDIRVIGTVLRWGQGIFLDRKNKEGVEKALADAKQWIAKGECVGIFPEAHIAKPERMGIARPGAALLALETGCDVLPCGMIGAEKVWPRRGRFRPRWNAVTIHIGEPVGFREYCGAYAEGTDEEKKVIITGVSTLIMREVAELAGKEYTYGDDSVDRLPGFARAVDTRGADTG